MAVHDKIALSTNAAPGAIGPYSQGIAKDGWIYISGQVPLTPNGGLVQNDIRAQTRQCLSNVRTVLKAAALPRNVPVEIEAVASIQK